MGFFQKFIDKKVSTSYAKMMTGQVPVFSSFGNDIYASDIVQNAIGRIAHAMSKLQPKHIQIKSDDSQTIVNDEINRLLKFGPNELMTTSDFLEKITYLRIMTKNAYIYPTWETIPLGDGKYKRRYTGFYPLNPSQVEFLEDASSKLYIRFIFPNFEKFTMPYSDIIHWRKDFTQNDFVGGDINGNPNNSAMLKLLETSETITQSIGKGIKAALSVQGIIKVQTMLDDGKLDEERKKFEEKLNSGNSGFMTVDLKNDFTPIKIDPKIIDKDTMEFINSRILANYGVPLKIYNGDFTEQDYQAFYEETLEEYVISLGRAFSKTLFTKRELEVGNEIICYSQGLMFTNMTNKIAAADILSQRGTLTDNQLLAIFGYPPFEGGDVRKQSLNYINRDIADSYQLSKTKGGVENA